MLQVLMLLSFAALGGVLLYGFASFDRLMKSQYQFHRETWITDGKPSGFFWRAPGSNPFTAQFTRMRISTGCLFKTPAWAKGSAELVGLVKKFRHSVIIWNVGVITLFVVFINFAQD